MLTDLKNVCFKLKIFFKEKRLKKQKLMLQFSLMSGSVKRVK
jgi:hypothetical protein